MHETALVVRDADGLVSRSPWRNAARRVARALSAKQDRLFAAQWYRRRYMDDTNEAPWSHYQRQGRFVGHQPCPIVDPPFIAAKYDIRLEEVFERAKSLDELCAWFSCSEYLQMYPDVQGFEAGPAAHFLEYGIVEGRSPRHHFTLGGVGGVGIAEFPWRGRVLDVRRHTIPASILAQIDGQAAFDTEMFAPGRRALPRLPEVRADDFAARALPRHEALLGTLMPRPDIVIVLPSLIMGGSEKYAAAIAKAAAELGARCVVLTTDGGEATQEPLAILRPLREVEVVSLRGYLAQGGDPEQAFALLLLALRPRDVFIINSNVALSALRRHALVLRQAMRVFVTFFSDTDHAEAAPYAARYLRDVAPHAVVISDNRRALNRMQERIGHAFSPAFVELPCPVALLSEADWEQVLERRVARHRSARPPKLLWLSRWDRYKAPEIVSALTSRLPELRVDVFGAPDFPATSGVNNRGVCADPARIRVEEYDALLFTSHFEGMPNVVLEMATRAVPLLCSDVGGLREVFDDTNAWLVPMARATDDIASDFARGLRELRALPDATLVARVKSARGAVERRHHEADFKRALSSLLGRA